MRKIKRILEKLKKIKFIKIIRNVGIVSTSLLLSTNTCFAGVGDSVLATGTASLISDLTNWLLILAPTVTVPLIAYFLIRKSASDEMDNKRWDNRIKVALICCIGVVIASGIINVILGYYR